MPIQRGHGTQFWIRELLIKDHCHVLDGDPDLCAEAFAILKRLQTAQLYEVNVQDIESKANLS